MRVLHIPTSGVNAGGITKFILDSARELESDSDVEIRVLSPHPVEDVYERQLESLGVPLKVMPGRERNPVSYMARLVSYLREQKFDLVHVHGSSALMAVELVAARIVGVPARFAHSHNITCDHRVLHRLLTPVFQHSYTHALACSEPAGEWLFERRPFDVIYNAVDLERFTFSAKDRLDLRGEHGIAEDALVIGHIGHFNRQKNHEFLIRVFAQIRAKEPQAILILVGSGPTMTAVRQQIDELNLGDSVIFTRNITDVQRWMSAMDVFVLPSRFEGFSIVLAETQANALSAITSTGTPTTVAKTQKVQYLPLEEGPEAWAQAVLRARVHTRQLSAGERDGLQVFDTKKIAAQLRHYYVDARRND